MKNLERYACLCLPLLFSGCSYIGSFLVCNFSGADIIISYRAQNSGLFSDSPCTYRASLDGHDVELGNDTLVPFELKPDLSITIPDGHALATGNDVNPWMHEERHYGSVKRLVIIQASDSSVLMSEILPSFVQDLGNGNKGIIIK